MALKLKIINPLEFDNWDNLVLSNKNYSFFHSSAWVRVLHESYHYTPRYFARIEDHKFKVLIPVMEIDSFLTGRRGVSLPFSDACEPILSHEIKFDDVLDNIIDFGERSGWKHIEFRFGKGALKNTAATKYFLGHILDLDRNEQEIFSNLRNSTKRNIKKSKKLGVDCKIFHSLDSIKEFYRLNCITRKCHGLPPQPWSFFNNVFEHIISAGKGFIVLAFYNNQAIAGAVYFCFGEKAIYKYGASEKKFQHLRSNNVVMWTAIEWCSRMGFKSLDFGKTEPENRGLLQYKRGWRGKENVINYCKYSLKANSFVQENLALKTSYNLFKTLPSPLLKTIGKLLYQHVG